MTLDPPTRLSLASLRAASQFVFHLLDAAWKPLPLLLPAALATHVKAYAHLQPSPAGGLAGGGLGGWSLSARSPLHWLQLLAARALQHDNVSVRRLGLRALLAWRVGQWCSYAHEPVAPPAQLRWTRGGGRERGQGTGGRAFSVRTHVPGVARSLTPGSIARLLAVAARARRWALPVASRSAAGFGVGPCASSANGLPSLSLDPASLSTRLDPTGCALTPHAAPSSPCGASTVLTCPA